MKKKLSQVLDHASIVISDGYEIEEIDQLEGNVYRLSLDDDYEVEIKDQDIEINSDGEASVQDTDGNTVDLIFRVSIPIREEDFPLIAG